MKNFSLFLLFAMLGIAACDLQPTIKALPDTVGEFITARYPTLLADPTAQPEIYNSAATDYGVYASPEIYGSSDVNDYVLYSSVDDYIVPPQPEEEVEEIESTTEEPDVDSEDFISYDVLVIPEQQKTEPEGAVEPEVVEPDDEINWDDDSKTDDQLDIPVYGGDAYMEITVVRGDTLYLIGKKYNMTVDELASLNNLSAPYPLTVGQKLRVRASAEQVISEVPKLPEPKADPKPELKPEQKIDTSRKTTTRVDVDSVTVAPGDTLYSLSRKYSIPVNDLAVMNNLSAPFALYAGQQIKVPDLASAPVRAATPVVKPVAKPTTPKTVATTKTQPKTTAPKTQQAKPATKQATKPESKPKQTTTTKAKATTAKKSPTIVARSSSKFSWPVRGKILSNYGAKNNGLFNDGINISAARGTAVVAAENGVVAYAGNEVKGMGNLVIVQHSDGWMTVYAHMDSMNVRRGARVSVGQKIGAVGQTGKVDKPQLHFEVRKGTKAYNPISYLKK